MEINFLFILTHIFLRFHPGECTPSPTILDGPYCTVGPLFYLGDGEDLPRVLVAIPIELQKSCDAEKLNFWLVYNPHILKPYAIYLSDVSLALSDHGHSLLINWTIPKSKKDLVEFYSQI